jgi:4-oxalocrotonate tautomerase
LINRTRYDKEVKVMPVAQIKVIEGVFSEDKKQEMIRKVTDAIVSVEGEGLRDKTVVLVEEIKSGDWGIGGNPVTTQDVKNMTAKQVAS